MKAKKDNKIRKNHAANQEIINEITYKLKKSKSIVLFEYQGLTVADLENLRKSFKPSGTELKIYKNTLVNRAIKEATYTDISNHLTGANALMFNYENELNSLGDVAKFAKTNNNLKIKCGVINTKLVDSDMLITLSKLPNKNGLISMFLSCLHSPLRNFMNVIKAVADKKAINN